MVTTLSDITEFIIDTKHNTPEYAEHGYPCIRTPNIGRGYFVLDDVKYVNEETYLDWTERAVPRSGDLILAREAPIGNVAWIPPNMKPCIGQRTVLIRPKVDSVDSRYLTYLLLGNACQNRMHSMSGGATVAHLNMSDIRTLKLPDLPSLPTQRKIAAILSAYDDLIENNTRRIAILEEMAQMLYREWFVRFRFPGHESVRMVDSSLGPIPEGWEVKSFTDEIDVLSGGTPKTSVSEYWNGEIPWMTPKDIQESFYVLDTERKITKLGLSKCNSVLYPAETVFITARGTVGRCVLAAVSMAMSQTSYALIGHQGNPQHFVYLLTLELVDALKKAATGAVFDTIIVDTFRSQDVAFPLVELRTQFAETVMPLFTLIKNLQKRNVILRAARDLLLPRLISGELDVAELEIAGVSNGGGI